MKQMFFVFAIAYLAGVPALNAAGLQSARRTPGSTPATQAAKPRPAAQARPTPATTHVMHADFVAYDVKTKTLTVKDEKGQTSSAPLEGRAIREIGQLHPKNGDHVMLTYRDNAKGEHQAISHIQPAKGKA